MLLALKIGDLEQSSMLDLKTHFRARKYTRRIIKSLGIKPKGFLMYDEICQAAEIGRIHSNIELLNMD